MGYKQQIFLLICYPDLDTPTGVDTQLSADLLAGIPNEANLVSLLFYWSGYPSLSRSTSWNTDALTDAVAGLGALGAAGVRVVLEPGHARAGKTAVHVPTIGIRGAAGVTRALVHVCAQTKPWF